MTSADLWMSYTHKTYDEWLHDVTCILTSSCNSEILRLLTPICLVKVRPDNSTTLVVFLLFYLVSFSILREIFLKSPTKVNEVKVVKVIHLIGWAITSNQH